MRQSIDKLCDLRIGYQVREAFATNPQGTHLVIQAKDIDDEVGPIFNHATLDSFIPVRSPEPYLVGNGDVIFLSRGRKRVAVPIGGLSGPKPVVALYYFFILRLKAPSITPSFLAWAINSRDAQDYLASVATGTGMPFVSKNAFARLEIEIPPLRTQDLITKLYNLSSRESRLLLHLEKSRRLFLQSTCDALYEGK